MSNRVIVAVVAGLVLLAGGRGDAAARKTAMQIGKYRLIHKLATGGMAEVFLAKAAGPMGFEKMLVVNWVKPGREIPWQVYSRQPVNVRFSHAVHVQLGKLACENCHGTHGASERLARYEENRISGYSRNIWGHNIGRFTITPGDGMKMSDCEQCHEKKGVEAGCLGCHQ